MSEVEEKRQDETTDAFKVGYYESMIGEIYQTLKHRVAPGDCWVEFILRRIEDCARMYKIDRVGDSHDKK